MPYTWDIVAVDEEGERSTVARGTADRSESLLAHGLPSAVDVQVVDERGQAVASAESLRRAGPRTPIARLTVDGTGIAREDLWPSRDDLGSAVILPGGEIGRLTAWWNSRGLDAWTWSVEFRGGGGRGSNGD